MDAALLLRRGHSLRARLTWPSGLLEGMFCSNRCRLYTRRRALCSTHSTAVGYLPGVLSTLLLGAWRMFGTFPSFAHLAFETVYSSAVLCSIFIILGYRAYLQASSAFETSGRRIRDTCATEKLNCSSIGHCTLGPRVRGKFVAVHVDPKTGHRYAVRNLCHRISFRMGLPEAGIDYSKH